MGRTITSVFKTNKNKSENKPVYLYTLYDYDGASNNLYFAQHSANVVFDGITYLKFPISFDIIGENSQGEIDVVRLKCGNVSRLLQYYLETYDLRGKKIGIKLVWLDNLANTDALITDDFFIDSYTSNEKDVIFTISSKFDVLSVTLPCGKYLRNNCRWKFKGTECGYSGAETTCNRTFSKCQVLGNQIRYGGFPSIPANRIYVG